MESARIKPYLEIERKPASRRAESRMLRSAWEKAVEDKLLGGVIHRFNPEVHTKKLDEVRVTPVFIESVNEGMTMCSKWVHDQAYAINAPVPTAAELTAQLDKYKDLLDAFKAQ